MILSHLIRATLIICLFPVHVFASDSLTIINVKDYGAKGNGIVDETPAFAKAVKYAERIGGSGRIVVPSGNYLFKTAMDATGVIVFNKAKNLTFEGLGKVQLIVTDPDKDIIALNDCENVSIRNIFMDRRPFVFTQGTITSVNPSTNSIKIAIDKGYDDPDATYLDTLKSVLPFRNRNDLSWDQTTPPPKMISKKRVAPGQWEFVLNRQPRKDYEGMAFVLWDNTYRGAGINFLRSIDCSVENSGYYGGGGNAGFNVTQCRGTITIKNYYIGVPERSGRLFCAAGGSMEVHNRATIIMDGCDISRIDDDAANIMSPFYRVLRQEADNKIVVNANARLFEQGDHIGVWDWVEKNERDTVRVTKINKTSDGFTLLELDKNINILRPDSGNYYSGAPVTADYRRRQENDSFDRIVNLNTTGQLVVRNCRISSARARSIVIKAQNCLVENNSFYGNKMPAILGGPKFYWEEGTQVRNLIIRNNLFENISSVNIDIGATKSNTSRSNRNIVIEGNRFLNFGAQKNPGAHRMTGYAIRIQNAVDVTIENNTFVPSPESPKVSSFIVVEASDRVTVQNNRGESDRIY